MTEQRYRAVLQVQAGMPVVEVADLFGVSRQAVHRWLVWYRDEGLDGLADRSHRPDSHPLQTAPEVEAAVCELRRSHPRWGQRRIEFELGRNGCPGPVPGLSTIYRVLVRNGLIDPVPRRRRRKDYKRWQRDRPMELWQMDIVGGVRLAGGGEVKVVTGVDDHSRYSVIATVVPRATGRAVCLALLDALRRFGIPDEMLTDNGKQFTARFNNRGGETMFDRICRENGITHRLTKPRSPTTTGKVERFHQTLERELLDDHPPFDSLTHAQTVIDNFRVEYNTARPHQSLRMEFPADRFIPRPVDELGLRIPPRLADQTAPKTAADAAGGAVLPVPARLLVMSSGGIEPVNRAVEVDRMVPASGNLAVCGQQFWLGPTMGGVTLTLWANTTVVHLLRDGTRIKTVPSRLTDTQLRQLLADGGRPAGPAPATPGPVGPIEVDRLVNACGQVGLAGTQHPIGYHLAGQRVTVRLDRGVMQILDPQRTLLRALPNPIVPADRKRIRDARPAGPAPSVPDPVVAVQRRVSSRGALMVAGQKIHVGNGHAGLTVDIHPTDTTWRIYHHGQLLAEVPRTTSKPIARFKARKPEPARDKATKR